MSDRHTVPRRRRRRDRLPFHERPTVQNVVVVATVLGGAATIWSVGFGDSDAGGSRSAVDDRDENAAAASPESDVTPSPEDEPSPSSTCWSLAGDHAACAGARAAEVVGLAPADCSQATLVAFMGGDPQLDVTWISASTQDLGTGEACVASAQREWSRSLQGAFASPDADELRACVDTRVATTPVGCDVEHTVETAGAPRSGLTVADCTEIVGRYTGVPVDRLDARLQVQVRATADGEAACAVAVTGGDVLTASLRGIGPRALPISSG